MKYLFYRSDVGLRRRSEIIGDIASRQGICLRLSPLVLVIRSVGAKFLEMLVFRKLGM